MRVIAIIGIKLTVDTRIEAQIHGWKYHMVPRAQQDIIPLPLLHPRACYLTLFPCCSCISKHAKGHHSLTIAASPSKQACYLKSYLCHCCIPIQVTWRYLLTVSATPSMLPDTIPLSLLHPNSCYMTVFACCTCNPKYATWHSTLLIAASLLLCYMTVFACWTCKYATWHRSLVSAASPSMPKGIIPLL